MEKRKNLNSGFGRKDSSMIFGRRTVLESFEAGKTLEKVFIQKDAKAEIIDAIKSFCRKTNTAISLVPVEKLNRITRRNHQGVVAFLALVEYSSLHHIISADFDQGKDPMVVLLDQVTDVRNIGSIARSAECAGVSAMVLPTKGSGQINSDAMKASAGALNHLPVCKESNLYESIKYLKNSGLQIIACSEKGDANYFDIDMTSPLAIIMGSEEEGISNQLLKLADQVVKIPMVGKVASLNVANAASIILFEAVKQRL